jgi:hypothetical protein
MMEQARPGLTPGIPASRWTAGRAAASGLVPASGPVVPSASTPQAAGIAATAAVIRAFSWVIRVSQKAAWSSRSWASSPWWSSNMPARASTRSSCLAFIRVRARAASVCGSRSPAIMALIMSLADSVVSLLATLDSLISASLN